MFAIRAVLRPLVYRLDSVSHRLSFARRTGWAGPRGHGF